MSVVLACLSSAAVPGTESTPPLSALPGRLELTGLDREHGLVVTRRTPDGRDTDVTRRATYTSSDTNVVLVDGRGQCRIIGDGAADVVISHEGETVRVPVSALDGAKVAVPSFRQDIEPLLTRSGCNAGGCHGKLAGQNGFRLSLRGFAPEWDHDWLTKEGNGRRVNYAFPAESLLVGKPTGAMVHEGGTRFRADSRYARTMLDWIAARAPGPVAGEVDPDRLEVLPGNRELRPGESQQLVVRAHYPDGRVRDVSWLTQFFSNDENVVTVKPDGLVRARSAGKASVRVHFQGLVESVSFALPREQEVVAEHFEPRNNEIDGPVFELLRALRIPPSPGCDDRTFLRRAFLDTTGTLPTPGEVAAFVADRRADKRARLVDDLLARPEWADYWTLQLADLLQNRKERDHDVRGVKGVRTFHAWLRAQLAANRGWDAIARDLLLARGDVTARPEIGYFLTVVGERNRVEESELPDSVAQAFLGTRIGCARCHNHPLERYTQDDFYHFAAYFSKVRLKREKPETGWTELTTTSRDEEDARRRLLDQQDRRRRAVEVEAAIGEEPGSEPARAAVKEQDRQIEETRKQLAAITTRAPAARQPRTGQALTPRSLDRVTWKGSAEIDPREAFVDWMVGSEYFRGAMVNRLWKHFMGVGVVEPVDDLRASNPPANPALWALLNREFAGHGFDLRHVMRLILNSRAYQLGSETLPANESDARFHSHYYPRRLPAEVLLDSVAAATGVPVAFAGYPLGLRAVQLPEPGVGSYFLTLFGRSDRVTACACERQGEVTLPQLLHLRNSEEVQKQIESPEGRLAKMLRESGADDAVLNGLFEAALGRPPTRAESGRVKALLDGEAREAVFKDLFWALLNSKEFAFNH